MKRHNSSVLICVLAATLATCGTLRDGMEGHRDAVARVDGFTLTVDHAAELLAKGTEQLAPATPIVVDPLTDLWIGYTLLAIELASPDTFNDVDLTPLTRLGYDQELVWRLYDDVILTRADVDDSELRAAYERDKPYTAVQVQHILIKASESATAAELDSLRRLAESLQERAMAGADFGELAKKYSDDPSSAARGGRLGWVRRGRLVPELEKVVFRMRPGQISETVRSRFGYHIFKVTDLRLPDYESVRDQYLVDIQDRRVAELEETYIDSLFNVANPRLVPGAEALAKRLAASPRLERLDPAERRAVMARYRGGVLTVGEYADFVIRGLPDTRDLFSGADSARITFLLRELVRNELLAQAARNLGFTVSKSLADSLRKDGQRQLSGAVSLSRFRREELVRGDSAISAAVDQIIADVFTWQRSPRPVERLLPALRIGHTVQVYPDRFPAVAARLAEIRETGAQTDDHAEPAESK